MNRETQTWDAVRRPVLERDGFACVACKERLRGREAHVHHVIPRALGGTDAASNLVSLCSGCHAAHHPRLQARLSRRLIERWAWRLARWLDRELPDLAHGGEHLGGALRLLGIERLHAGQLEIVLAALQGRSLLMVSPTGSGKSLCFQLPAILRPASSIVVAPLKALMADQVSGLQRRKIPATFINSDLDTEEKNARYDLVERGAIKLLYCAPERFDAHRVKPAEVAWLEQLRPSYLVVDEAHCIDKWGGDFRPSYARLGEVRRRLGSPPVLAFTATAGVRTQQRVLGSLGIPDAAVFVRGVDRPNIAFLRLGEREETKRYRLIAALLRTARHGRSMVFAPTIRIGNAIVAGLREQGPMRPSTTADFARASASSCSSDTRASSSRLSTPSSVPARSAWASTCPMSVSWSTGSTPLPSRTTCRSSVAPGATAGRRSRSSSARPTIAACTGS